MNRLGIKHKTLLVTLIPILLMAIMLESYFIVTHFANLDRSLLERSLLLTRQLASSCEYAVFSGNTTLLQQNVDSALSFADVKSIAILDENSKPILATSSSEGGPYANDETSPVPIYQDDKILRLYEPILATQINLDGLVSSHSLASQLGSVRVEVNKQSLNRQKNEYLLVSLLFTLLVIAFAMTMALKSACSVTEPIMQMHQAIRRITGGELDTEVVTQYNVCELHELAKGINEMEQQLLRNRTLLESRIDETADDLRVKKAEVEQAHLEKDRLNENLALALAELQAIMEANPDILYVFNTKNELVQWNPSFAKLCGLTPEEMCNRHMSEFFAASDRGAVEKAVMEVYAAGSSSVEVHCIRHDGVLVPYQCNGVVLKNTHGEIIGFTGTGRDISERKMAAEHLHHMAHYDILTDLPNRSLLSDRLQQAIIACKRNHGNLALMFLDLDMFKYVNDNLGHDIGDLLLKEVAKRILGCLRESDTAARVGGDEFVVLLPLVESAQTATLVAEKMRHALAMTYEISGHKLNISASIGVVVYPEHGIEEKVLLKNADTAMYLAKHNGRNTVVLYSSR